MSQNVKFSKPKTPEQRQQEANRLISELGGVTRMAKLLGVTKGRVCQMRTDGVPAWHLEQIAALRPDLFEPETSNVVELPTSAFDWDEAEQLGFVVCRHKCEDSISLAVFANNSGEISIIANINGKDYIDAIEVDKGFEFAKIVTQAVTEAVPIRADYDAAYANHLRNEARSLRFRLILGGKEC